MFNLNIDELVLFVDLDGDILSRFPMLSPAHLRVPANPEQAAVFLDKVLVEVFGIGPGSAEFGPLKLQLA